MARRQEDIGSYNKSGQVLGRKGADTRARALAALEQLLISSRGVEPTAAAVARAAGISAPAFYLYFGDVGEAILAVVGQLGERFAPVLQLLEQPWPDDERLQRAKAFVEAYFAYWSDNAPLLRARNRMADQGDERFVALRVSSTEKLSEALVRKTSNPPFPDGLPCTPAAAATTVIVALERLATVASLKLYPGTDGDRSDTIAALANILATTVKGSPAD